MIHRARQCAAAVAVRKGRGPCARSRLVHETLAERRTDTICSAWALHLVTRQAEGVQEKREKERERERENRRKGNEAASTAHTRLIVVTSARQLTSFLTSFVQTRCSFQSIRAS